MLPLKTHRHLIYRKRFPKKPHHREDKVYPSKERPYLLIRKEFPTRWIDCRVLRREEGFKMFVPPFGIHSKRPCDEIVPMHLIVSLRFELQFDSWRGCHTIKHIKTQMLLYLFNCEGMEIPIAGSTLPGTRKNRLHVRLLRE